MRYAVWLIHGSDIWVRYLSVVRMRPDFQKRIYLQSNFRAYYTLGISSFCGCADGSSKEFLAKI